MLKELKEDIFLFKVFALIVSLVGGIYILSVLWKIVGHFSDIIVVLVLAWVLSFVLEPVTERLMKLGLSRTISAILLYLFLSVLIVFFVLLLFPIVSFQIATISSNLPEYLSALSISDNWVLRVQEVVTSVLSNSLAVISSTLSFLFSFFIVLFMSFYFLVDRERILGNISKFVPARYRDELAFISSAVTSSFAAFVRVQILFGVVSGFLTWLVLRIFGTEFAISAGVLSGFFSVIPVVGPLLSLIPPLIASSSHGLSVVVLTMGVLIVLQFIELNIVGPKIWGSVLKIHPVLVFLSFLIGYKLAGGWGSVFAIPVAAIVLIISAPLIKHFGERSGA